MVRENERDKCRLMWPCAVQRDATRRNTRMRVSLFLWLGSTLAMPAKLPLSWLAGALLGSRALLDVDSVSCGVCNAG